MKLKSSEKCYLIFLSRYKNHAVRDTNSIKWWRPDTFLIQPYDGTEDPGNPYFNKEIDESYEKINISERVDNFESVISPVILDF